MKNLMVRPLSVLSGAISYRMHDPPYNLFSKPLDSSQHESFITLLLLNASARPAYVMNEQLQRRQAFWLDHMDVRM